MEVISKNRMPVYVRIDDYKDVLDVLSLIKNRISEAKQIINDINEIKEKENREIDQWKLKLDDINKKIELIDKALFEPEI